MKNNRYDIRIEKFLDTWSTGLDVSWNVYTIQQDWWYKASIRMTNNTTSWSSNWQLFIDGNVIAETTAEWRNAVTYGTSDFLYLTSWTTITYKTRRFSYWNWTSDWRFVYLYPYHWIPITPSLESRIRPIFLKDLWQTITWTIYWKHIDNTYYWWIMIEKSETATTWSITPWNFQWYITTNFNWEIIKIPYYL